MTHKTDNQMVKTCQICIMKLHIGHVVKQVYKKSGIGYKALCQGMNCSRSTIYHIFNSESITTEQLWNLSKVLRHNFFEYYSKAWHEEFPSGEVKEPEAVYTPIVMKRKVMVEVSLTEKEYEDLLRKKV